MQQYVSRRLGDLKYDPEFLIVGWLVTRQHPAEVHARAADGGERVVSEFSVISIT